MKREINIEDYEGTIDNKIRKMKEPSEKVIFDENHSIKIYYCTVYGNECSYIQYQNGLDFSGTYDYGHVSVNEYAKDYLDYKVVKTDNPLELAYYWHCYKQIDLDYDCIPGINHDLQGRIVLLVVFNNCNGYIETSYITDRDKPDSVITFKDIETAKNWYKEDYSDIMVFTIPASYVDTFDYSLRPYRKQC